MFRNLTFADTFWTNPQFRFEVVDPDENDDDNTGTVIVALAQKGRRKKKAEGAEMLTIGYVIYAVRVTSIITFCNVSNFSIYWLMLFIN